MAKIKIEDLDFKKDLNDDDLSSVFGGYISRYTMHRAQPRLFSSSSRSVFRVQQTFYQPFKGIMQSDEEEEIQT